MVYFLGRECVVAITTENAKAGLEVTGTATRTAILRDFLGSDTGAISDNTAYDVDIHFCGARQDSGASDFTVFGTYDQGSGVNTKNEIVNLTGVDLSLGAMDEDLSFIGQRATMRVEVKKENSITLTRKKTNDVWDVIYNDARFGVTTGTEHAATDYETGLSAPDNTDYGYRVYIKFKDYVDADEQGGYLVLPNCCITEHSVTLGADATTEESMTFQSYLDPIIVRGALASGTLDGDATGF